MSDVVEAVARAMAEGDDRVWETMRDRHSVKWDREAVLSFWLDLAETAIAAHDSALKAIVAEQAEDDGLWFQAQTAPEAYLQQELRRLHAAIEGRTPEECARAALGDDDG